MPPEAFMSLALEQARLAQHAGEVPVGAVLVLQDEVIARGFNRPIRSVDPTAHAEVLVLREAAQRIGNYRLTDAVVYVTVEPCMMCVGAMIHARVGEVVYGTVEPRAGALVSAVRGLDVPGLNHRFAVTGGVLERECRELIQQFFKAKRADAPRGVAVTEPGAL